MRTTESASWVGRLLGDRYQVTAKLGEGGMGFVYQAHDLRLDCIVVLKVPRPHLLDDAEFAQRFDREIRSLVRLRHPHVVPISDVGRHDGTPFAVMQYLAGGSLENRLYPDRSEAAVPLPPYQLSEWLPPVTAALDFIHQQGFIHRDIKPGNILFDENGNAFVSDFGVVKTVTEKANRQSHSLTGTGMVIGTPHYMAPELVMGERCDGRVDQYALAATVYQVLSGRVPVDGPTPAAILVKQTKEDAPALDQIVQGIPEGLASAVRKGLAKDPRQRFASCSDFAAAVLAAVPAPPREPLTPGKRKTKLKPGEQSNIGTARVEQAQLATHKAPRVRPSSGRASSAGSGQRKLILAALLLGGVLLTLTVLIVVLVGFSANSSDQRSPASVPATTAAVQLPAINQSALPKQVQSARPQVKPIRAVKISPGQSQELSIDVERDGYAGPIQIRVSGLPEKVSGGDVMIPTGQNGTTLRLTAAVDAPAGTWQATVGPMIDEQQIGEPVPFTVRVESVAELRLTALPSIQATVGGSHDLEIKVERRGCQGAVTIELAEMEGIEAGPVVLPANQDRAILRLKIAPNAVPGTRQARVTARLDSLTSEARLAITIEAPATIQFVKPIKGVYLKPGETAKLEIRIERRGFEGPVPLQVEGLSQGVTARETIIGVGADRANIEITATANAPNADRNIQVVARMIDKKVDALVEFEVYKPGSSAPRPPPKKLLLGLREKLDQPVTIERGVTNMALQDLVATLSDRYGVPIGIDRGEYRRRGLPSPETLPIQLPELKGVSLQSVLERIASQVKGKLRIERESVVITYGGRG